jgi:type II secretion system protein N
MSLLKKKTLWFVIYGFFITLAFLYLLFPSDIAQSKIEQAVHQAGLILKTESLNPSLPFGFKMNKVSLRSASPPTVYFQGDFLDLQFSPLNFLRKNKNVGMKGKAYGGIFSGRFSLDSLSTPGWPQAGKLDFENIDIGTYALFKNFTGKEISGKAQGSWTFNKSRLGNISGTLTLLINSGYFTLTKPFLGLNRIDFERGEMKAQIENGKMKLENLQISGPQMDFLLNGEITLADDFKNSQLDLKGEMAISDKKVKMNININGTVANPILRYI